MCEKKRKEFKELLATWIGMSISLCLIIPSIVQELITYSYVNMISITILIISSFYVIRFGIILKVYPEFEIKQIYHETTTFLFKIHVLLILSISVFINLFMRSALTIELIAVYVGSVTLVFAFGILKPNCSICGKEFSNPIAVMRHKRYKHCKYLK